MRAGGIAGWWLDNYLSAQLGRSCAGTRGPRLRESTLRLARMAAVEVHEGTSPGGHGADGSDSVHLVFRDGSVLGVMRQRRAVRELTARLEGEGVEVRALLDLTMDD